MSDNRRFTSVLSYHFGKPQKMTWSYPLMWSAIFTGLFFIVKFSLNNMETAISTTSLVSYAIFMPVFIFFSLIFPAVLLREGKASELTGKYTGIGILIIAALSGLPIMLISTILDNFMIWTTLKMGFKMVYPAFFYYGGTDTKAGLTLAILTDTVIPAFGTCLFFFGLVWSRFRNTEKKMAYLVIMAAYTLHTMSVISVISSLIIAWWCCRLRDKTSGIYAPFLCLVSSRIFSVFFTSIISKVDIYTVQSASDIPSTYFYAALPAILIAIILLGFFLRLIDDFYYSYNGTVADEDDTNIPALVRNLNYGLILALMIMITIWILIIKGVHI